jgi:DNA adenine methylase
VAAIYARHQGRLIEPFAGGAAVFFRLEPKEAILGDTNRDLIQTYVAVRDHVEALISTLEALPVDRKIFGIVRDSKPQNPVDVATRFIYLNRTAFNGLYRVNKQGAFNVPFGCKPGTISVDGEALRACARALNRVRLVHQDFRTTLRDCEADDFIYLDPPYTVRHNENGFNRYNERLFSWSDQEDLAYEALRLASLGAHVVISNADHRSVRSLYPVDTFKRRRVVRSSRMAAKPTHRGPTSEILINSLHRRKV